MILDLAAVVALATTCAPTVAPSTLLAVARVESGLNPLAIGINGRGGAPVRPRSLAEAVRAAEGLIAAGRDIDLGLGQINVRNLAWLGLSVADAFDPCRNLAASARILVDGYRRARPAPGREQAALRIALSYYNTGRPDRGFRNGYVRKVAAAALAPSLAAPTASPRPAAWDVFARAQAAQPAFVVTPIAGAHP